jgi:hypothetical protein
MLDGASTVVWIQTTTPPTDRTAGARRLMVGTIARAIGISTGKPSAQK